MSKKNSQENKQLNLKLKESPFNILTKFKERVDLLRAQWDIKRYTKSTWVWSTIVLTISLLVTQVYTILESISILPKRVPILKIYVDTGKSLTATQYIYLMPILTFLILVVGIIFSNKYYNKERHLSNTLLLAMFLGSFLITVSLIRLINLY